MLQALREMTCRLFGHEDELLGTGTGEVTRVCPRCGLSIRYTFAVEPGFLDNEFPGPEDFPGNPSK